MAEPGKVAEPVLCHIEDGVAILTLNNPPLNVVYKGLTEALGEWLQRLADDASVRVLVVTGAGDRAFCAGSDIAEFRPLMKKGMIVPAKLALQHRVFAALDDFPKPTLAAINGLAYGGGLEIAVCCDLIVADAEARFALPEIKLGVFPGSGGPVRVTRRVGESRAKELMFLGEPINAGTALAWGLINRVTAAGQAMPTTMGLARTLASGPPLALSLCKRAIDLAQGATEDIAIAQALPLSDRVFSSTESQEGVRAFLAKESPNFPDALHPKESL